LQVVETVDDGLHRIFELGFGVVELVCENISHLRLVGDSWHPLVGVHIDCGCVEVIECVGVFSVFGVELGFDECAEDGFRNVLADANAISLFNLRRDFLCRFLSCA
jgi:hypothetical protein